MTITKSVTFIAKPDGIEKMKELLTAMVKPSKKEDGSKRKIYGSRNMER